MTMFNSYLDITRRYYSYFDLLQRDQGLDHLDPSQVSCTGRVSLEGEHILINVAQIIHGAGIFTYIETQ